MCLALQQGNLYSVHPFFTAIEASNNMFGCLLLNSNAMGELLSIFYPKHYSTCISLVVLNMFTILPRGDTYSCPWTAVPDIWRNS